MSRRAILLSCFCLGLVLAATGAKALAGSYGARSYYGGVHRHQKYNYSYRPYYYKPYSSYGGYRHHYAVYHHAKPKYVYYYNPYKKQYWGRCPVDYGTTPTYSLLAEADRKGNIDDIPESAFPPPGKLPPLPESTDGATLELPPDDSPADRLPIEESSKGAKGAKSVRTSKKVVK